MDNEFKALTSSWLGNPAEKFLGFIWLAYEDMKASKPCVKTKSLERSITQLIEPRVRDNMTGDEPFYIQHEPYEYETMSSPPAQPPQYDLAFVFRADESKMWPLEAKVLKTPKSIAEYIKDIKTEFLTCRYAPFSNSGAMLGYLLSGSPYDVFTAIEQKLNCTLRLVPEHPNKPNRFSCHTRNVPLGKTYPKEFICYHIILEFPSVRSTK